MTTSDVPTFESAWRAPSTVAERTARGRDARHATPRSTLSRLTPADRDPLGILDRQNETRVPDLVPLRIERMSASPFAFFRGTAALQAADMADDPHSGILVPSCGDAHVANFGFYASPQRTLVFDLNDFDEAAWAPWEWDVKRLVTSLVLGGQEAGRDESVVVEAALAAVRTYAAAMRAYAAQSPLARYFEHFDVRDRAAATDPQSRRVLKEAMRDAKRRTGERAGRRLTEADDRGRFVFVESPPTMTHADAATESRLRENVRLYTRSANIDIRMLLTNYTVSDLARRVVGVGSVGTLCALVLFQDGEGGALILQAKQAGRSVLEEYGRVPQPPQYDELIERDGQGGRVVAMQRILQALSDPFLGHLQAAQGDFYVRQFHDMKGSIETSVIDDASYIRYARACAAVLARAHAQSPTTAEVAGYIGNGRVVGEALLAWAFAYTALSRDDYAAFTAAHGTAPAASV